MAFLCILGKVVPENIVLFLYKNFLDQNFSKLSVLNQLLYSVSYFETTTSNASDFVPFFHNSTNFESKFLERFRFWNKMFYNASDFELNLIFLKKKQILMKVLLSENHFWIVLHQETPIFGAKRFLRNQQLFEKMEKKTVILSNL